MRHLIVALIGLVLGVVACANPTPTAQPTLSAMPTPTQIPSPTNTPDESTISALASSHTVVSTTPKVIQLDNVHEHSLALDGYIEPPRLVFRYAGGSPAAPTWVGDKALFGWTVGQIWDDVDNEWKPVGNREWHVEEDGRGMNAIPGAQSFWTVNGTLAGSGTSPAGAVLVPYRNTEKMKLGPNGWLILSDGTGQRRVGDTQTTFTGEGGGRAVSGGGVRAADLAGGVDQDGADFVVRSGKGTGNGEASRVLIQASQQVNGSETPHNVVTIVEVSMRGVRVNGSLPLCLNQTCINETQLQALLALIGE